MDAGSRQIRLSQQKASTRIALVGTGFVSRGLYYALQAFEDLKLTKVLTRRPLQSCQDYPDPSLLTDSLDELISSAELVIECSGDVFQAALVTQAAFAAGLPVVTLNAEFHVSVGSYFVDKGFLTEAEGDQPGCLAVLEQELRLIGFKPLVYGNLKKYLNLNPQAEQMRYWSEYQGISLNQVTSFTDGTKVEIETALVANGLGTRIPQLDTLRPDDWKLAAQALGEQAQQLGQPLSCYFVSPQAQADIFILARHEREQAAYLRYYKLGDGPYYLLWRHYHLCHLEVPKTLKRVIEGQAPLLHNGRQPIYGVAAVAKLNLKAGQRITRAIGSFELRGQAFELALEPDLVPIGLLDGAVLRRDLPAGELLRLSDLDLPESYALKIWLESAQRKRPY